MTALDHAASLQQGDSVRWKRLELDAFASHPAVQRALDPSGKHGRPKTWRDRAGIALAIGMFLVLLAPVLGLALLFSGRFSAAAEIDYTVGVPAAGILFLVGCLLAVPWAVQAVITWTGGQKGFGLFAVAIGAAAFFGAASRGAEHDVVGWALWSIPIAAFALSGVALLIVDLLGKRETERRPTGGTAQRRRTRLAGSLDALSEQERQAVAEDLRAAIGDLATRGVIRPQDADWAAGAELGGLSRRMSQPRR